MNTQRIPTILCAAALLTLAGPVRAQVARIDFTAKVTDLRGTVPAGVALGSAITGHVQVDLQTLPTPDDSASFFTGYFYGTGTAIPGFLIQFDTGSESILLDSVNAASNGGATPGIFLYNLSDRQFTDFQLRNAGQIWSAYLHFADTNPPLTLLTDNHFPNGLNIAASTEAYFEYDAPAGQNSFRADLTSVSLTIIPPPCDALIDQITASNLPANRKQPLLATARAACASFARGECETARAQLSTFQSKVQTQLSKSDPALAHSLTTTAQTLINYGCVE